MAHLSHCLKPLLLAAVPQVKIVQVADEQQSSSLQQSDTISVAGRSVVDDGRAAAATGSRFGFIRDLARRRSRAGGGSTAAVTGAPVWASLDSRDSQTAPLLEYEMQEGEVRVKAVQPLCLGQAGILEQPSVVDRLKTLEVMLQGLQMLDIVCSGCRLLLAAAAGNAVLHAYQTVVTEAARCRCNTSVLQVSDTCRTMVLRCVCI